MTDSIKRTNALLTHLDTLSKKVRKQTFHFLSLIIAHKTGNDTKTLLVVSENTQQRYAGHSVDIASTIYLSSLDRAISNAKQGKRVNIEFYAIDRHDVKQDLGGVQS